MPETFLGERLPRSPARRRLFFAGWLTAALGLAGALIVMPLYVSRGLENGPSWLAANYLVLDVAIVVFSAGGTAIGVAAWSREYALLGLISAAVLIVSALELPESARDAFGRLERRSVDVVESIVDHNRKGGVRTADGQTYWWVEGFGVVTYPRIGPGHYDVILTSERHWIVGATRSD
jgi:hypothetical protein